MTRCSFGKKGSTIREYCTTHKPPGYVNIVAKYCIHIGCNKQYRFGKVGCKPEYCVDHKLSGYVDVVSKTCLHDGCNKQPSFGEIGCEAEYCTTHKPSGYVNVKSKRCKYEDCLTQSRYGKIGGRPEYCTKHKLSGYVDVVSKMCVHISGCNKRPAYGKVGSKIPEYCVTHKPDEYVNVKTKTCGTKGCLKIPTYGKEGSKTAEFCFMHKPIEYKDIKSKICKHDGCSKYPIYGKPGFKKLVEYCKAHKPSGYVDVKHAKCIHKNCTIRAKYGLLFGPLIYCSAHRTPNSYTKPRPKCSHDKCKEKPCYTDKKDSYPVRCEDHKEELDTPVHKLNCSICDQILFIKTDTRMCNICAKIDISIIRREKEFKIKTLLEESDISFIHDKTSDPGCHKHRPDFLIDGDTHYIVIEVDENQHSSYTNECETARMVNIQQGFGGMRVLFIRFNPDGYTDSSKKKIRAGITLTRTKRLLSLIKSSILHPPPYLLSVVKLYYDGDNEINIITQIDLDTLFKPKKRLVPIVIEFDDEDVLII